MSNLLKSKFFLGTLVVAIMFVAGFAVTSAKTASADCSVTVTLKLGSRGVEVQCLQGKIGTNPDGAFGPMTLAAVKAFQASKGLTADGIVGPMTRAALNGVMTGNFPAGCTTAAGYSTTTGLPCNSGPSTGLPAGCSSTAGYSPLTGKKCDSTTTTDTGGPLVGGAGSLDDVDNISSLSDEDVAEGASNVKVAGWTLTADNGSDLAVTSFKLTFEEQGAGGSDQLEDYADKVTVWQGSTKIGSADVSDFSENSGVYSKTINLSGAVVRADKDSDFFVSVDAISNIDSGDIGSANNDWDITLESVRVQDATGAIVTDSTTGDLPSTVGFSFETVGTASDLELKVSKTSGSSADAINEGHVVEIDDTSSTNDVPLLAFDLKATGDVKNIQDIPVKLVSTGTGQITDIATSFSLWMDNTQIDTVNVADVQETSVTTSNNACDNDDTTCWVHFDDVDFDLSDETSHFIVKADINDASATLVNGDTLTASMTATEVAAIDAEDQNGDSLSSELTGTAVAETVGFYTSGIMAKFVSASAVATPSGVATVDDTGTYKIVFDVTAFNTDVYVDATAIADESGGTTYQDIDASTTSVAAGVIECSGCDTAANSTLKVAEGTTERFTVTIAGSGADVFASAALESILYATTAIDGDTLYTFNMGDYHTDSVWLDSN